MRLFARCPDHNHKFYVNYPPIQTREQLPFNLDLVCPYDSINRVYSRNQIHAEVGNVAVPGAIIGGLIGIIGGPLGMLIGGAIGAGVGAKAQEGDTDRVRQFEAS